LKATDRRIEATNMIKGISKLNPADDLFLCIARIWSAYEVIGEMIMNIGARKPVMKEVSPIFEGLDGW
jgi:adenylosuccinate synthase